VEQVPRRSETESTSRGRLCLDFASAVRGLGDADGAPSKEDLGRWLHQAGLTERLPGVGTYQMQQALALAAAIEACARATIEGAGLPPADVARINPWAAVQVFPELDPAGGVTWRAHRSVEGALARIARDAVELIGGDAAPRIRRCAGEGCTTLFVDRSPSGIGRWCSMTRCGNRAKVGRYRRRQQASSGSRPSTHSARG
jgi:predicted RNA-binding Zn ribbon-like protein